MGHVKKSYGGVVWPRCYGLAQHDVYLALIPMQTDKDSDHQVTGDPCLTVWLRDKDTEHRPGEANSFFCHKCLRKIMGYH